ncbi:MAG: redoxin domain-containing protein, partial [Phycisphaerales bacterium]
MNTSIRRLLLLGLAAAMLSALGVLAGADDEEKVTKAKLNKPAPDFTLTDSTGQKRTLSDYKDKIIVLEWFNTECTFVRRQYSSKSMQKTLEAVKKLSKDVVWLAVNSTHNTTPLINNFWIRQYKLKHPILLDKDGKVGRMYDARTTPHMFVIDAEGVLRYHGAVDDDALGAKVPEDVTNYVLNAVRQIVNEETVDPSYI